MHKYYSRSLRSRLPIARRNSPGRGQIIRNNDSTQAQSRSCKRPVPLHGHGGIRDDKIDTMNSALSTMGGGQRCFDPLMIRAKPDLPELAPVETTKRNSLLFDLPGDEGGE
jgi:hypothetical protein